MTHLHQVTIHSWLCWQSERAPDKFSGKGSLEVKPECMHVALLGKPCASKSHQLMHDNPSFWTHPSGSCSVQQVTTHTRGSEAKIRSQDDVLACSASPQIIIHRSQVGHADEGLFSHSGGKTETCNISRSKDSTPCGDHASITANKHHEQLCNMLTT